MKSKLNRTSQKEKSKADNDLIRRSNPKATWSEKSTKPGKTAENTTESTIKTAARATTERWPRSQSKYNDYLDLDKLNCGRNSKPGGSRYMSENAIKRLGIYELSYIEKVKASQAYKYLTKIDEIDAQKNIITKTNPRRKKDLSAYPLPPVRRIPLKNRIRSYIREEAELIEFIVKEAEPTTRYIRSFTNTETNPEAEIKSVFMTFSGYEDGNHSTTTSQDKLMELLVIEQLYSQMLVLKPLDDRNLALLMNFTSTISTETIFTEPKAYSLFIRLYKNVEYIPFTLLMDFLNDLYMMDMSRVSGPTGIIYELVFTLFTSHDYLFEELMVLCETLSSIISAKTIHRPTIIATIYFLLINLYVISKESENSPILMHSRYGFDIGRPGNSPATILGIAFYDILVKSHESIIPKLGDLLNHAHLWLLVGHIKQIYTADPYDILETLRPYIDQDKQNPGWPSALGVLRQLYPIAPMELQSPELN